MIEMFFAASQNTLDGLLLGAKLIGAILVSVAVLYLLLKLVRVVSNLVNRALYKRYLSRLNEGSPKMTFEEFVASISGIKVYDKPDVTDECELKSADVSNGDTKTSENDKKGEISAVAFEREPSDADVTDSDTINMASDKSAAIDERGADGAEKFDIDTKNSDTFQNKK